MLEKDTVAQERISIPEMADELQCHKQSLFKIIQRLGIATVKQRDPGRGNQMVATVTSTDAVLLRREFALRARTGNDSDSGEPLIADDGLFYLIQLEPTHDPGRIKLGFTTDLDGRLQKHRCSAPFAKYLKTWPCRRTWERAAMDCLSAGIEQLHTEVFRASSVQEISDKGERFFAIMPSVKTGTDMDDGDDVH